MAIAQGPPRAPDSSLHRLFTRESTVYNRRVESSVSEALVEMISMTRLQLLGMAATLALSATASVHAEGHKAAGRTLV